MNKLQIFEFENSEIRTLNIDGQPWWVGVDVCRVLEIADPRTSLKLVDEDDRDSMLVIDKLGRNQKTIVINESGLYSLILKSRKPEAKKFKRWITKEVIPSIRKEGTYGLSDDLILLKAVKIANERMEDYKKQLKEAQPKIDFYDHVTGYGEVIVDMEKVAKILNLGIGRNSLFQILRDIGILMDNNLPYQKYINRGYFRVVERKYEKKGSTHIYIKTMVSQKGLDYIRRRLSGMGARSVKIPRYADEPSLFSMN